MPLADSSHVWSASYIRRTIWLRLQCPLWSEPEGGAARGLAPGLAYLSCPSGWKPEWSSNAPTK